jgi:hypothetical protein
MTMHNTLEFFTEDELIDRVWDRENIQAVMAKRVYLAANEDRRQEINSLWVQEPCHRKTASYGKNWGYYIGMDNIVKYYIVAHHQRGMEALQKNAAADPSISGANENYQFGCSSIHPLSTPLIEISADGNTAKGIWYSVGHETTRLPDGTADAVWHCMKIGADLVKESGEWRIWHLVEIYDVYNRAGENYTEQPVIMTPDDPSLQEVKEEFGEPNYALLTHDSRFNWRDDYPWMPEEYVSYDVSTSYGPKGHPRYKEAWEK